MKDTNTSAVASDTTQVRTAQYDVETLAKLNEYTICGLAHNCRDMTLAQKWDSIFDIPFDEFFIFYENLCDGLHPSGDIVAFDASNATLREIINDFLEQKVAGNL